MLKPVKGVFDGLVKPVKVIWKVYESSRLAFRNEYSKTEFRVVSQLGVLMLDELFIAVIVTPEQIVMLLAALICGLNSTGNSILI
jgi:hypothetical protein